MRRIAACLTAALLVLGALGAPAPAAAAVSPNLKIVLVVGATNGTTSTYRAWMDDVYTTAKKYSTNVVKVYSPDATWPAVKAAAQGANILVYMGHGNGFPSPYRSSPYPQSQNGFGLNAAADQGDDNVKYFGEYYVSREITLAPNALVILSHLCYASGNSEPGRGDPTQGVARQRMDNYAAGFIAAGARAVIADGHMDPQYYIDALFTTHKTVDQIFRDEPWAKGTVYSFDSVRSPGYGVIYDPEQDSPVSGYYRSMTSIPGLTADDVLGSNTPPPDPTPTDFTVPGAAQVTASDGAGLWADAELTNDAKTGLPPDSLPKGAKLRLTEDHTTAAGERAFAAHTLDGSKEGFVRAADLAPRDSVAPTISRFGISPAVLSPVISGSRASISAAASEAVTWTLTVTDADGTVLAKSAASGREVLTSWDGRSAGAVVPDGTYTITLVARDAWGNAPDTATGTATVDATTPQLTNVGAAGAGPVTFSPNGDHTADTITIGYSVSEAAALRVLIRDAAGHAVRDTTSNVAKGAGTITWNGRNAAGSVVPDGDYAVELVPTDAAGNRGAAGSAPIRVYTALHRIKPSPAVFFPSDHDAYSKTITLAFSLDRPATVSWKIINAAGSAVRTLKADEALAAGGYSLAWDGTDDAGKLVPRGVYRSVVDATNGIAATRVSVPFTLDAFKVVISDAAPHRGETLTFTITSAELLKAAPSFKVTEPGRSAVKYKVSRVSSRVYTVTIRLVGTRKGSLAIRIGGWDRGGGTNVTHLTYALQ